MVGNRKELSVWKKGYLPWRFSTIIPNIRNFFRNVKYARQRAVYGFCDADVWNLDYHLLVLFRETFYHLAKNHYGYPFSYDTSEEWEKALIQAAEDCHFSISDNYTNEYWDTFLEKNMTTQDNLFSLIRERNDEIYQLVEERKERALNWIVQNFSDLWD